MLDLEKSPKGEISKETLLQSLGTVTKKPGDYWKLNELRDKIMNGKSKLTRDEVRAVLNKNKKDLRTLIEDPIKQHPIISEVLYDLEGSFAGAVNQIKLQKTVEKLAAQHSVPTEKAQSLVKSIMAQAEQDKTVKVGRHELRRAMEAKVLDIDAVFYPKQKPVLKHLTPIDKVLQQLERQQEGEVGENELVLALTESAQLNGEKPDPLEIKILANSLMAGEKKLPRDKLRKIMYKSEEEIASAIRESEDVFTPYHSLRIGNLSSVTSDEDLVKFFKSRGYNIEDASVMYDKDNAHSKRVGYLNFGTKEEADRCLAEMNKCKIDDKAIILGETEDEEMARGARVKTSNLPMDFDQRRLRALFKHYGNIKSCKLEQHHDGTSRGIGHI